MTITRYNETTGEYDVVPPEVFGMELQKAKHEQPCGADVKVAGRFTLLLARMFGVKRVGFDFTHSGVASVEYRYWRGCYYLIRETHEVDIFSTKDVFDWTPPEDRRAGARVLAWVIVGVVVVVVFVIANR